MLLGMKGKVTVSRDGSCGFSGAEKPQNLFRRPARTCVCMQAHTLHHIRSAIRSVSCASSCSSPLPERQAAICSSQAWEARRRCGV